MRTRENLGRKKPTGSGFPGHVPAEAVWDESRSKETQGTNIHHVIKQALPLGLPHTVQTVISILARPGQINESSIASNLRAEVSQAITAASISRKKRDQLLRVLDAVPSFNPKQIAQDIAFGGELRDFMTEKERQAIISFISEVEGCSTIEDIILSNPRSRKRVKILSYKIGSIKERRIEFYNPEKTKISIKIRKREVIVDL